MSLPQIIKKVIKVKAVITYSYKSKMEILEHKKIPFPEDLEGRLNAVFNIVNTELKSATLLVLDDSPAESTEIKARIRQTIGEGYLPISRTFGHYCHLTLFPIGAVAEEIVRRESVKDVALAYSLTEAGKRYGRPIAAGALQYAVENNLSLYQILGSSHSPGKTRAPLSRIKILKELASKRNLRIIDLADEIGLNSGSIGNDLKDLKKIYFVEYDSTGDNYRGKGIIVYKWIEGKNLEEIKSINMQPALTRKLAILLRDKGNITPIEATVYLDYVSFRNISHIYSGLVRQGFAVRERGFVGGQIQSQVSILDRAIRFLSFESRVEDILSDRTSAKDNEEVYLNLVTNPNYSEIVRTAIGIYKRVSPGINQRVYEEMVDKINQIVRKNPGIRPCEIREELNHKNIQTYLMPLVEAGRLRKKKEGRIARYYINE